MLTANPAPALVQTQWARLLIETLASCGVHHVVVSPGSRSTPLTMAVAASSAAWQVSVVIDERAAAFVALGSARASGRPVALICTSGTAPAHYLPALIEAGAAHIPIIAITADRPTELLQAGAPQTIDQIKMFGGFVRGYFDLGAPESNALSLRACRRLVSQAVACSMGPLPGPMHINVPLRKPLEPVAPISDADHALQQQVTDLLGRQPTIQPPVLKASLPQAFVDALRGAKRGIIAVAGLPAYRADIAAAIADFALASGFAVIAESGSGVTFGSHGHALANQLIMSADFVCKAGKAPMPDIIVQIGGELASGGWIDARQRFTDCHTWMLSSHGFADPFSNADGCLVGDLALLCGELAEIARSQDSTIASARGQYLAQWQAAIGNAHNAIEAATVHTPSNEIQFVGTALRSIVNDGPSDSGIIVGNSLPVRVIDQVTRASLLRPNANHWVITQRGANGIDGFIAGAIGATLARGPALMIIGDVCCAHDIGSFALLAKHNVCLPIVVINNGGGRIFDTLPIAKNSTDAFARFFTTATGIDIAAVARGFGLAAVDCGTPHQLQAALHDAWKQNSPTIIVAHAVPNGVQQITQHVIATLLDGQEKPT
jgi:2-succinyl-5-enolpyruvyl-6-hydroxy-3-cyclohexene-1-carboxylate synthase